jgi:hypothetical protein
MQRPDDTAQEPPNPAENGEGEDHREDPPGYDLDEQRAIEELERERDQDAG